MISFNYFLLKRQKKSREIITSKTEMAKFLEELCKPIFYQVNNLHLIRSNSGLVYLCQRKGPVFWRQRYQSNSLPAVWVSQVSAVTLPAFTHILVASTTNISWASTDLQPALQGGAGCWGLTATWVAHSRWWIKGSLSSMAPVCICLPEILGLWEE